MKSSWPELGRARFALVAGVSALVLASCGGGESSVDSSASAGESTPTEAVVDETPDAEAVAEGNIELLQGSDDVRDIEVLDVSDGSIATLRETVAGDRPVLLWFFSPH